jgi:organic radical activating enzyme
MKPVIPTLSMQVTYQCNIECKHCGPYCGPHEKDWMTEDEICDLIRQAGDLGAYNVVFTGGEPSLLKDKLLRILRFVKSETPIQSTRIVTNGKWATSYRTAYSLLKSWKDAGLDEVNISCGEYHQEFVSVDTVITAFNAAREVDFETVLLVGEFLAEGKGNFSPNDFKSKIPGCLPELHQRSPFQHRCHAMNSSMAMNYGRGKDFVRTEDIVFQPESQIRSTCPDVLNAITVHPNGNTTACCGIMVRNESLLNIGNWRQQRLDDLMRAAHNDTVLNWIRYIGLRDMKAWLKRKDPSLQFRSEYLNICDLCAEIVYDPQCQEILVRDAHERANEIIVQKIGMDATVYAADKMTYAQPAQ